MISLYMTNVAPQPPDLLPGMEYRPGVTGSGSLDPCGAKVILNVVKTKGNVFQFDLCDVIDCGGDGKAWKGYDVYACVFTYGYPRTTSGNWCYSWTQDIFWWTGASPLKSIAPRKYTDQWYFKQKISLKRGSLAAHLSGGVNPLIMTMEAGLKNPWNMEGWHAKTCTGGTGRAHGVGDILYFGVGVDVRGKDPKGLIRINYVNQPEDVVNKPTSAPAVVQKLDADKITYQQTLAVETGFKDSNSWIDRMVQIIHQVQTGDCLICAKARPALIMGPTAFENGKIDGESGKGVACLIELMSAENPNATCKPWETIFPMAPPNVGPPIFKIGDLGNLTCFRNKNPANQVYLTGEIPIRGPGTPCGNIMDVTNTPVASKLTITRADVWWYCGGKRLYNYLPVNWRGMCVLVSLNSPIYIASAGEMWKQNSSGLRRRRSTLMEKEGERNRDGVWIDAIGQARNIPDEFKLADEVAAGWESFPLFSAIFPITVNKNVNRINLVHYNVQRLANLTRDAIDAIHEQLSQTSLMALQNRIAVDMLLAEKGGVCVMFGDTCCTAIANNTAPDGKLTRSLSKLKALANEMKEQSGIKNPLVDWLNEKFGRWGAFLGQVFLGVAVGGAILTTCGCCCIPCMRTLATRTIERAINGKDEIPDAPPKYQAAQMETLPFGAVGRVGHMGGDAVYFPYRKGGWRWTMGDR